jgi:hypothetical protein
MLLNPDKTDALLVGTPLLVSRYKNIVKFSFAESTIVPSPTLKYLGVIFDSTLSFSQHCAKVASSVRAVARSIRHVRSSLDVQAASGIAVALGISKIDYCCSILTNASAKSLSMLQRAQNALARAVYRRPWFTSASNLLRSLHWLPVGQRAKFRLCVLTFKALSGSLAPYLTNMLNLYCPSRSLRSSYRLLLEVPPSRIKTSQRRFSSIAPTTWNSLQASLRAKSTLPTFRSHLKTHLFK